MTAPVEAPPAPTEAVPEGWAARLAEAGGTMAFTALSIVAALAIGAVVIVFSDPTTLGFWKHFFSDPLAALDASWDLIYASYQALLSSAFGGTAPISRTLLETTPLIFAGLSVALAFQAGLFNIGAAGQLIAGATAASYVGFHFDLPRVVHLPLVIGAGTLAGMAYGGIAGWLKARTGAHEVITTIMLNNIAVHVLDWVLSLDAFQRRGRNDPISPPIAPTAHMPKLPGPLDVDLGLVLAVASAAACWWLLQRSTIGFRMRAVGVNNDAARAAGMNVASTYLLSMALAGGLAAMAGVVNLSSRSGGSLTGGFYVQVGFDAIALALVGRAKPGGVVFAAVLFGALQAGATGMQAATDTPVDIIIVIQALIIMFVSAPAVVQALFRVRARRATGQQFATGWGAG